MSENAQATNWNIVALHVLGAAATAFLVAWGSGVEVLPALKASALATGTYLAGLMQAKPVIRTPDGKVIAYADKDSIIQLPPKP